MSKQDKSAENRAEAGRIEPFPSGKLTFLSPRPLPTGLPPVDHVHAVGEVTDTYLEFGTGVPSAFSWQVVIGIPFCGFFILAFITPLGIMGAGMLHGAGTVRAIEAFWEI